jgi:hypothetical protein
MSAFPRIDPNHPLAAAAREVNAAADLLGGDLAFDLLDLGAPIGQVFYLAEQRTLRYLAALEGHTMGADPVHDELKARAIVSDPDYRAKMLAFVPCWVDGMATGWQGHKIVTRVEVP